MRAKQATVCLVVGYTPATTATGVPRQTAGARELRRCARSQSTDTPPAPFPQNLSELAKLSRTPSAGIILYCS